MTNEIPRLGYIRGNVANHQDYDVFKGVHFGSEQSLNVAACCQRDDNVDFFWDKGLIEFVQYNELSDLWTGDREGYFDILDTSEFYRDYSLQMLAEFPGKKSVTVFDNLPFGISYGRCGEFSAGVDVVIARSPMIKRMLELEGVDPSKIQVVPSAVDVNLFKPGIMTNQQPVVLWVGRMVPEKGLWDLVVAMSGMEAELRVVGDGDIRPFVELSQYCKTNVNFVGPAQHEQLSSIMREVSLLVVPSIPKIDVYNPEASWVEQFGVVIIEGMASGLPVIASDTGSTRDIIVDGETGFLFPPRNWDILRMYIQQLLQSYGLRNEFGHRGRERAVKFFSSKVVGEKLAEIYLSI